MPFLFGRRRLLAVLLILWIVIAGFAARYVYILTRPGVPLAISRETTSLTGPLRKDGRPDYVALLNQRASRGVTPENNAAVPFWKAMGPSAIATQYRPAYFQMLGIPPLPENGDYFVDFDRFVAGRKNAGDTATAAAATDPVRESMYAAMKRPWSKQAFPALADWLAANEKPLALLVEASKRPRRYDPLVCGEKTPLIAVPFPAFMAYRVANDALVVRAMYRLGEGNVDEAWDDLLTCHRLARLMGQGQMIAESRANESAACIGDRALLQHGRLTEAQIAKMREDLDRLPPRPEMADKVDVAERFTYLDSVLVFSRDKPASYRARSATRKQLQHLDMGESRIAATDRILDCAGDPRVDWNVALRMGNAWFDRFVAAMRAPAHAKRRQAAEKLDQELNTLSRAVSEGRLPDPWLPKNPHEFRSQLVGAACLVSLSPSAVLSIGGDDGDRMQLELTKLAFALAAYHAEHGAYPAKLAELGPKYTDKVPKDVFNNDADLHYTREGPGYLLYSVGINGKDDGGKGYDDRKNRESWDDLVVHMHGSN
jgi:hypothetical protein